MRTLGLALGLSSACTICLLGGCLLNSGPYETGASGSTGPTGGNGGAAGASTGTLGTGGGAAGMGGQGGAPVAQCGDGQIDAGESCDDGNMRSGDGCSASCAAEPGDDCPGNPVSLGSLPVVLTGDMTPEADQLGATCGPGSMKDVVYAVTPTESGTMTVLLEMGGDKTVSVLSECGGPLPIQATEKVCASSSSAGAATSIWVHAGATYYVVAQGTDQPFTLTLTLSRCGDGVQEGLEQCDDPLSPGCMGCVLCTGPGEFLDPATKHCYRWVGPAAAKSWEDAQDDCTSWGGELAGIRNKAEFDFLEKHTSPQIDVDAWVGGRALTPLCSYAWANGEPWYTEWVVDQPNSSADQCVEFYIASGTRRLSDYGCAGLRAYLCERTPAGVCGDGIVQPGEQCDGDASAPGGTCTADCKISFTCNATGEFEDPGNKHCYKVNKGKTDWFQAKWSCDAWGGHLAVIDSDPEAELIRSQLSDWAWIGAWEGAQNDGRVVWESSPVDCSYQHWNNNEPNYTTEDCVVMANNNGRWIDVPCDWVQDYVCEKALLE